jgi:ATP-grasp domain, R2K clade family 2
MRRVYLQIREDGEFTSRNVFSAYEGFREFGYEMIKYHTEDMPSLDLSPDAIVVGGIGMIHQALQRLGITPPLPIQPPEELHPYLGRRIWQSNIAQIRKLEHVPVFIKPLHGSKTFTGHVISEFKDLIKTSHIDANYPVMAQDALKFVSEWRVYLLGKEVKGIGQYHGDPLAHPDANLIKKTISAYQSPPVACGMDFAVLASGETVLLEINDAYSLGNYGVWHYHYARMLEARWDQLVQNAS